jgi:trans-aconitate methyltransferase
MISVTGILRRLGPIGRRIAWNREFRSTPTFVGARSSTMVDLVRKYGEGNVVVELACGEGSLSRTLADVRFADYQGFDISDEAVQRARADAPHGRRFDVGEMQDWAPESPFDLLIIEEAIYYLTPAQQRRLFDRAFAASPGAIVIVAIHSSSKHYKSVKTCREAATVLEEIQVGPRVFLVLGAKV